MQNIKIRCPYCDRVVTLNYNVARLIPDGSFSIRVQNALQRAGINTYDELEALTDKQLLKKGGMGKHSLAEIRKVIPG